MELREMACWTAIADLKWKREKINREIIAVLKSAGITPGNFLGNPEKYLKGSDVDDIRLLANKIDSEYIHTAKIMKNKKVGVISGNSELYPELLSNNLGDKYSPPVIFVKGSIKLLKNNSVAIVGSRNASEKALVFTDKAAEFAVREDAVVVSGFAKGVDRQALDSAVKYGGDSIIVLPQGILTFGNRDYEKLINEERILILSIFPPKAPWNVGYAMDRNSVIYGLASEIYVAESDSKGGTWQGAVSALKKGRRVYIRKPAEDEKNANNKLLSMQGAVAVDGNGKVLKSEYPKMGVQESLFISEEPGGKDED